MSKISNAFLMIKLLSNGRVYSVKELSMELGVTERMVRYYKEQLEMAGYIIESFKGPGGGYYINKNDIMNIDYLGTSGKIVKREIIPINMFEFEDNTYVTAFCKLRGSVRHFDLKKIILLKFK